jgi:hypothetical protein
VSLSAAVGDEKQCYNEDGEYREGAECEDRDRKPRHEYCLSQKQADA